MFERVTIHAADLGASRAFYGTVLDGLGAACDELAVAQVASGQPPTRGLHVGIAASSRAAVDAFWRAGVDAGYRDDGAPGPRPRYAEDYYGGFLLDPDGNSVEAVTYTGVREHGCVDHLWIRVADLAAACAAWEERVRAAGLRVRVEADELVRWRHPRGGSMTLLADEPASEHVDVVLRTS